MVNLLFISGSTRNGSFNTRLRDYAHQLAMDYDGVNATIINLADYPMPILDQDIHEQQGLPEHAARLKAAIQSCDGLFISSPEYNGFFPPLLKNALDWASRPYMDKDADNNTPTFQEKIAAISSAAPGAIGGLRGLPFLRIYLSGMGLHVIPKQVAVGNAADAFDQNGGLVNDGHDKPFRAMIDQFIHTTKALRA